MIISSPQLQQSGPTAPPIAPLAKFRGTMNAFNFYAKALLSFSRASRTSEDCGTMVGNIGCLGRQSLPFRTWPFLKPCSPVPPDHQEIASDSRGCARRVELSSGGQSWRHRPCCSQLQGPRCDRTCEKRDVNANALHVECIVLDRAVLPLTPRPLQRQDERWQWRRFSVRVHLSLISA